MVSRAPRLSPSCRCSDRSPSKARIWLAGASAALALPLMVASQIVGDAAMTVASIHQLSLRQTTTPDHMLGRVSAAMQVLGEGIGTLGMLTGGIMAELIGLRPTVGVAVLGIMVGSLWALATPLRHQHILPNQPPKQI